MNHLTATIELWISLNVMHLVRVSCGQHAQQHWIINIVMLNGALDQYQRALGMTERVAPSSLPVATTLHIIGDTFLQKGKSGRATGVLLSSFRDNGTQCA